MSRRRSRVPVTFPPLIFNCQKSAGTTCSSILNHFKRHLPPGYGKIGHFGTLDPFADGVYLMGVAGAQKLNEFIHQDLPKTYLATGVIGVKTDSGDKDGRIIQEHGPNDSWEAFKGKPRGELEEILRQKFCMTPYFQRPPMYSAAKHQGRSLHEYAREGTFVDKEPVQRRIHSLEVIDHGENFKIRAQVSSGTYIRTLYEDALALFGLVGHLHSLTRESIGHLTIEHSLNHTDWPEDGDWSRAQEMALTVDQVLLYPTAWLTPERSILFQRGVVLRTEQFVNHLHDIEAQRLFWVSCLESKKILGLAQQREGHVYLVVNFATH